MFKEYHEPLYTEMKQHEASALKIQSTIDTLSLQTLSSDQVLHDARGLNERWEQYSNEEKRFIIDNITDSIIIGKEDIEIRLKYIPTLAENPSGLTDNPSQKHIAQGGIYLPIVILPLNWYKYSPQEWAFVAFFRRLWEGAREGTTGLCL